MVITFILSAAAGFLTKTADEIHTRLGLAAGIAYGLLMAFAASLDSMVATVFLPAVLANALAGKIDSKNHVLGLATFTLGLLAFSVPLIRLPLAVLAFAAAFLDEKVNLKFPYPRPLLPIAAALISLLTASWTPLLAVITFDASYFIAERAWKKQTKPKTKTRRKKQKKA